MKDEELNVILEQMAEEVPPMPADFHARWMNAVRAEARDAAPAAEDTTPNKTVFLVRWTRILSVAAAFVFLIGGTLLWRSTKQSLSVSDAAEKRKTAAVTVTENAAAVPEAEEPAAPAAGGENAEGSAALYTAVQAPVMEEAATIEDAGEAAKADDAGDADLYYSMKAAGAVQNFFAASSDKAAGAVMMEEDAEEADYAMEAACEAVPVTAEPTAAPTAAPTAEPIATPEPPEVPEPEKAGFLQDAGAFFTDMGDFLLAALPYLLVLAVPAAAALVIRRKKARK